MNNAIDVALVIFQAKAAISKACEGRACLPECLRALDRFASVETAPAPLFASCANAAKRTPADAPPHGARLRVPVGAVRTAWRAFAFITQRARGMFRRIWSGSAARLPAWARPVKIAIAAVAITLGVTCPSGRAVAAAVCVWQGDRYVCSGDGSVVNVVGGGDGVVGDVVITNIVGVCTNCVAMSPEFVHRWKSDVLLSIYDISFDGAIYYIQEVRRTIDDAFIDFPLSHSPLYGTAGSLSDNVAFLKSVGYPLGPAANRAADVLIDFQFSSDNWTNSAVNARYRVNVYDAAVSMFNSLFSDIEAYGQYLDNATLILEDMSPKLASLSASVDLLSEEECTAQWNGPSSENPGSGSGNVVTNQVSGNWCTFEQGEAIKDLLKDVKDWLSKTVSAVSNVASRVEGLDSTVRSALFSTYTYIPTEEKLGTTWQDLYLAGQPTDWGYEPTNILQRIELLIYGMSGVGTNATDVSEASGVDPDEAETAGDDAKNAIDELSIDATSASEDVRSIMDALRSFFTTFNAMTGDSFGRQVAIGSYSIEIGETRHDVPALTLYSDGTSFVDVVQSACRSFLTCLYLLFAVFCAWRFYAFFLGAVVRYSKWAQELLSSLFAD